MHGCEPCPPNSVTIDDNGFPATSKSECTCSVGYEGNPGLDKPCVGKFSETFCYYTLG